MTDPKEPDLRPGKRIGLLELDAMLDASLYAARAAFGRFWDGYSAFMDRFTTGGLKRLAVELSSDGATLILLGGLVMLVFARPAFELAQGDWRNQQDYAVVFQDRYGTEIGRRGILQSSIPLDEVPDHLVKATLATEDRRFFEHFGIDLTGTLRAFLHNARNEGGAHGGSSITQQLAKNLFLSPERSLERKIKEAFLALWLEANLSKREILELYFARAYMGGGTFGVEAASQFYFGKSVRDVSLAEAAMLAGLYKAPTKYAPHSNLPSARGRANQVLSNMVDAGYMNEGQVFAARRSPATPINRHANDSPDYFLDWAYDEVKDTLQEGKRSVVVRTTLDMGLQQKAQSAIETALRQQGDAYNVEQGSIVAMETDGAVRAMVGGRDYGASQFNRATKALRQPGSSFKPFVYLTAFLNGYGANSIMRDEPLTMGNWSPQNYARSYSGAVTLSVALARSINTIPVRLANAVGRARIIANVEAMGINSDIKNTSALPLGVAEVTAFDMANAYCVFASGGKEIEAYGILTIRDAQGELLFSRERDVPPARQLFPSEKVAELNGALNQVVENGTGTRANIEGLVSAGKTGTTQDYRDAWFIGFTGNYVASVWFGNDDYSPMNRMTGGTLPAMVWTDFMTYAHSGIGLKPIPGVERQPVAMQTAQGTADAGTKRAAGMSNKARDTLRLIANELEKATPLAGDTPDITLPRG